MTAILLAAGVGKRMGGKTLPKCLHEIGGKTLLQRLLEALRAAGVTEWVLVTGFESEQLIAEAQAHVSEEQLHTIFNERFTEGAILSLLSAKAFLDRDVLIMDTDVLCPQLFLERLVHSKHANALLVDNTVEDTGEEQLVFGQHDRVLHITKQPPAAISSVMERYGESVGFLKLEANAASRLRAMLEEKVNVGLTDIEHEQAYPDLFSEFEVGYETVDGYAWTEIDTQEDLEVAKQEVLPSLSPPKCFNRQLSDLFLPFVLKMPLTPNMWTLVSLSCGLAFLWCLLQGKYVTDLWAAFWFQCSYVIDNWDGEVARAKGLSSPLGAKLDILADGIIQTLLPLALAQGLVARLPSWEIPAHLPFWQGPPWIQWAAGIAVIGMFLDFYVTWLGRKRGFGPSVHGGQAQDLLQTTVPGWQRQLKANLTNENFSLAVVLVLICQFNVFLLWGMAIGTHFFWISFLVKHKQRF